MNISIEQRDNIVIFTIKSKKLDSENSPQVKAKVLIECQPDVEALIIDLTNVEILDSSGLGVILLAHRQMNELGSEVVLAGVREEIYKLMEISHIHDLFDIYDSVDEAVEDLTGN